MNRTLPAWIVIVLLIALLLLGIDGIRPKVHEVNLMVVEESKFTVSELAFPIIFILIVIIGFAFLFRKARGR